MKLAIMGCGPLKEQYNFDRETWATVSIYRDENFKDAPFSKLFIADRVANDWPPLKIAKEKGIPIVGRQKYPYATEYLPMNEIEKKFASTYFMNSISYMIAYALYMGYDDIELWGVWGEAPEKYNSGAKYVTHWLGVATGMGVKWKLCPDYDLWEDCYAPDKDDEW